MRRIARAILLCTLVCFVLGPRPVPAGESTSWPQFRGPSAAGIAVGPGALPDRLDPAENAVWKVAVPRGRSSPVVHSGRIYVRTVSSLCAFTSRPSTP